MKKAQVTLFVIIGLVIVIVSLFIYMRISSVQDIADTSDEGFINPANLRSTIIDYVDNCMKESFQRGKYYLGVNPDASDRYAMFVNKSMDTCVNLDYYRNLGIDIQAQQHSAAAELTDDHIKIIFTYPILITLGKTKINLDTFEYQISKLAKEKVEQDSSGAVTKDTQVISSDNSVAIKLPKGTVITRDGVPFMVDSITIKMTSPEESYNVIALDKTFYELGPSNIQFSPAIEVVYKYPPGFLEAIQPYVMDYCNADSTKCISVKFTKDDEKDLLIGKYPEFL